MNGTADMSGKGARWRPLEIVAMVGGFIVFWPVGLAILALKIWQKRSGDQGPLADFGMAKFEEARRDASDLFRGGRKGAASANEGGWSAAGGRWSAGASGNRAFDEWREAELARLDAERRKLDEAMREFNEHRKNLRKARDREEFESFVRERDARKASGQTG